MNSELLLNESMRALGDAMRKFQETSRDAMPDGNIGDCFEDMDCEFEKCSALLQLVAMGMDSGKEFNPREMLVIEKLRERTIEAGALIDEHHAQMADDILVDELTMIAIRELKVSDLTTRNSDRLDFVEVSKSGILRALRAAAKLDL